MLGVPTRCVHGEARNKRGRDRGTGDTASPAARRQPLCVPWLVSRVSRTASSTLRPRKKSLVGGLVVLRTWGSVRSPLKLAPSQYHSTLVVGWGAEMHRGGSVTVIKVNPPNQVPTSRHSVPLSNLSHRRQTEQAPAWLLSSDTLYMSQITRHRHCTSTYRVVPARHRRVDGRVVRRDPAELEVGRELGRGAERRLGPRGAAGKDGSTSRDEHITSQSL